MDVKNNPWGDGIAQINDRVGGASLCRGSVILFPKMAVCPGIQMIVTDFPEL